jgi:hypothetical protein
MLRSRPAGLAASLLVAGLSLILSPAQAADPVHTDTVTLKLQTARGLRVNGSAYPSKNKACATRFADMLGQEVVTEYKIDTEKLIMTAQSTLQGTAYTLSPLGISGQYAFGQYMTPQSPDWIYGVLFSVNMPFSAPVSNVILQLDETTNCLISSASQPLRGPERIRFGAAP